MTESRYGAWAGSYMRVIDGQDTWFRVDGWHRDLTEGKLALFDAAHPLDTYDEKEWDE